MKPIVLITRVIGYLIAGVIVFVGGAFWIGRNLTPTLQEPDEIYVDDKDVEAFWKTECKSTGACDCVDRTIDFLYKTIYPYGIANTTIYRYIGQLFWSMKNRELPAYRNSKNNHGSNNCKDELPYIVQIRLQNAFFGNGIYGYPKASEHYYQTGVQNLTLCQKMTLIEALQAPSRYIQDGDINKILLEKIKLIESSCE